MAALRSSRPNCIRAAFASTGADFRRRRRNTPHRFKVNHKKNHMDLIEGLWREVRDRMSRQPVSSRRGRWSPVQVQVPRTSHGPTCQFLDPYDGESSEDNPGRSIYGFGTCCPGDVTCVVPSRAPKSGSPEVHVEDALSSKIPDLLMEAASWVPASPGAADVDMQPVGASSAAARGWAARLQPEDWRMTEERPRPPLPAAEPAEPGRYTRGRTGGSWLPPRLGSEKDKGPKLILSKRKLELLLAEPERSKRKKQYAA